MKRAWIIEAPGKKEMLVQSLKAAGHTEDFVLATYGRLYDLPDELTYIDKDLNALKDLSLKALAPGRVEALNGYLANVSEVIIATDSDLEENSLPTKFRHVVPIHCAFHRVHLMGMTPEHVIQALENRVSIDKNKVNAALARRLFDRHLGYQLPQDTDAFRQSMGRIITPIIASIARKPLEMFHLRRKLKDGWVAKLDLPGHFLDEADLICGLLANLPECAIHATREESMILESKPLTGNEATLLCAQALNKPVKEVSQALQDNYMRESSYPRTDSRRMGVISQKWAQRMAEMQGVSFSSTALEGRQAEHLENAQDAHEALVPLTERIAHDNIPDDHLSVDEAVLRKVAEHTAKIGAPAREVTLQQGHFAPSEEAAQWQIKLNRVISHLRFERMLDPATGKSIEQPEFARKPNQTQVGTQLWINKTDYAVAKRLVEEQLGRPSTLAEHTHNASKYLKTNGLPNRLADLMLFKVRERAPELLKPGVAQRLEHVLSQSSEKKNIKRRLAEAWSILSQEPLGGDQKGLDTRVSLDQSVTTGPSTSSSSPSLDI